MPNKLSKKELKDIVQWDIKNWKNALSFWESHFDFKPGMKVLVLGDREGGLSLYFAKKGFTVICSDYLDDLCHAKELHKTYGVENLITYSHSDMRQLEYADEEFDIIAFKSVIGALASVDEQIKTISEIRRTLKKGGAFLFAENAEASKLHQYLRKKFVNWKDAWRYTSDSEFNFWRKNFTQTFFKKIGIIGLFGRTETQRNILATADDVFTPIIPKSWRYIGIGVFIK